MSEGEAVESAEAELASEESFSETTRPKEILQEGEIDSSSPVRSSTPASHHSEPHSVQPPSESDTPAQCSGTSDVAGNVHSFRVQFTPSTTTECSEGNTSEAGVPSADEKADEKQTISGEQEGEGVERTDAVLEPSLVTRFTDVTHTLDQRTSPGSGERDQQLTVSGSGSLHTSAESLPSTRTESDHDSSVPHTSDSSRAIGESEPHQTSTPESSSSRVIESVHHLILPQPPSSSLTPTSNTQDTSSRISAVSSPMTTPIATPRVGRAAESSNPHSVSTDLGASPYVVVREGEGATSDLVEVIQFESPGLLYAKSTKERHNLDMLKPADEVAEDVLGMIGDDPSHRLSWMEDEREHLVEEVDGDWGEEGEDDETKRQPQSKGHRKVHPLDLRADSPTSLESPGEGRPPLSPLDPKVLRDLELQARKVAASLDYIMENLHNSLHAMTVCAKQSVMLHREAVDNLHSVVDTNVKATYSFLAKFEELKRQTAPLNTLSQQIKDINKILKVLERNFRTP